MFIFSTTAAILAFINVTIAAFIFTKKKRDTLSNYLILCILSAAIWVGSNAAADISKTDLTLIFWAGWAVIGGSFFATFTLCLVELFTTNKLPSKLKKTIFFTPSVIFSILGFTKAYTKETFFPENMPTQIMPGNIIYFILIFIGGSLIYNILKLAINYKKESLQKKKQTIYIGLGISMVFLGELIFSIILPIFNEFRFYTVGPQFSIFLIIFTSYAILKHRLLDIKIAIQRSLIFSILSFAIIIFYLLVLFILQIIFGTLNETTCLFSTLIITAIGIFTVPNLKKYFQKKTDKFFFKDKYNYSKVMHDLSEVLNTNLTLNNILLKVTNILEKEFKIKEIFINLPNRHQVFDIDKKLRNTKEQFNEKLITYLRIKNKIIIHTEIEQVLNSKKISKNKLQALNELKKIGKKYHVELTIPLITKNGLLGTVSLGKKLSGDNYTDEDLNLLKTFSHQMTLALEKSQLYEQVKDYSKNLEKKVNKRTQELQNMQEKQLETLINIAHELQTPLTVLKGELNILQQKTPNNSNYLTFEKHIDHVSNYISNILKISKLEFSNKNETKTKINLSELLKELIEYFTVLCKQKNIKINSNIQPNISLAGNKNKLEELITNLVSNSVKYIGNNKKEINLKLIEENKQITLTVKDTGIGIAKKNISNLFKRFYRPKTDYRPDGTGLGLSICKSIIENYNGTIEIKSELTKGTKITIKFPI